MNRKNANYYTIIPANVRYDSRMKPRSIILYGEITALCNVDGYCDTENSYFAELYGVGRDSVSKWINELKKYGYIKVAFDRKDSNRRKIYINEMNKESLFVEKIVDRNKTKDFKEEQILMTNDVYSLYPSKCPYSQRSTGKGASSKNKIEKLLRQKTKEQLILHIRSYLNNCYKTKTFIKNFNTFLNNIPEIIDEGRQDGLGFKKYMSGMQEEKKG